MPEVACLMLTSVRGDVAPFDAIMAGAAGCLLKPVRGAGLVGGVRAVAAGLMCLDNRSRAQVMIGPGDGCGSVREQVGAARPP